MAVDDLQKLSSPRNMRGQDEGEETHLANRQTIHSGHFMVSRVHDVANEDYFDDEPSECIEDAFDFVTASKETSKTYTFGPRSTHTLAIDASLTKLFECMTLAYSGAITSPKWKAFRGMHLTVKDKIRLNNIIWREWHMQYIYHQNPIVCDFSTPLSDDIHSKPEAVVLEGKYWKRRLDTVTAEYKKWRKYYKERISRKPPDIQDMHRIVSIAELLERVKSTNVLPRSNALAATDLMINNDFMEMDFSDNFFASLNTPFAFPNPREFSQIGCADLIQPGLIQLQPNLDEFMDIDEILGTRTQAIYGNSAVLDSSSSPTINCSAINMTMGSSPLFGVNNNNINNAMIQQSMTEAVDISALFNMDNIAQFGQNYLQNSQHNNKIPVKVPNIQHTQHTAPSVTQDLGVISHDSTSSKSGRRNRHNNSPSSTITCSINNQKKDGFAVPSKPVPRKQRCIAPAPPCSSPTRSAVCQPTAVQSTSPSVQSTYLAQLLTKGTYPGAMINVKSEPRLKTCETSPSTTPTPMEGSPAINISQQPTFNYTTGCSVDFSKVASDFSTSVVLAAASQALGTSPNAVQTITSSNSQFSSSYDSSPQSQLITNPTSPSSYPLSPSSRDTLSPSSSPGLCSPLREDEKGPFNENRRAAHLSAEQKRRCNLKTGFDTLVVLVPALAQNPKASKADMLRKTAEFCKKLKSERTQMQKEADILRHEIEVLNNSISVVQSQLPETGVPVTRQRVDQMKEMFEDYVKKRTLQNWKFWIFSIIIVPLFDTFNSMVSTASLDDLCRTVLAWLDQHCSLVCLRPTVLNALRHLSTTTSILTEPGKVREQATQAVTKKRLLTEKNMRS